ncbi:MAG: hypothetical protein DMF68_05870 [Acidobacteria bacterium]|nr:MAG: hypothetical protein DMF68_05870 [Acidobacteriota bacterium]
MKRLIAAILLPLLLIQTVPALAFRREQEAAKSIQQSKASVTTAAALVNEDVIRMVKADFTPDTIIAQIKSSACNFVTTPAALQQLKEEGVPDSVILAMVMAAKSIDANAKPSTEKSVKVKIPNGVAIQVEAPFDVNSQLVKKGDKISFRVVNPVKVDGVVVVAAGATATAEVVLAERGGHFGRAGRLAWAMKDVVAVDGSRIPLQQGGRIVGDSHGAQVATEMAILSAGLFFLAPLALLHGFKRGENAILPAGKRIEIATQGEMTVMVAAPAN